MVVNPKVLALFIDGDNVQVALVPALLDKINEYGNPIIKKVYLNSASLTNQWEGIINDYSLHPVWVPNNTSGKNAADIALVIDAMDLLCERSDLAGFCIVSSDSDFTRLAAHIVGKNKFILGIGEAKTPKSFVNACSKFLYIEDFLKPLVKIKQPAKTPKQEKPKQNNTDTYPAFEKLLMQAYENISNGTDGWVQLLEIKEVMNKLDQKFQSNGDQNIGRIAEKAKAFAAAYPRGVIEIDEKSAGKAVLHFIRIHCDLFKLVAAYKKTPVKEKGGWVLLSMLGTELKKHPTYENGFSFRGIQMKPLSKIVSEMLKDYPKTIEVKGDGKAAIHLVRIK